MIQVLYKYRWFVGPKRHLLKENVIYVIVATLLINFMHSLIVIIFTAMGLISCLDVISINQMC